MTTVVYSSGPVTRWMWNVRRSVARVEAQVDPQAGGFDQDLRALVRHEVDVAGCFEVAPHREHDCGVDVVLRRAGRVVGGGLLAVDRAPREQRADLAHLSGALAGGGEHLPSEADHLSRRLGHRVREERHHVDLGVPEVVAVVAASGDALRGDALLLRARRGLSQLEQVPAKGLLCPVVAAEFDVGVRPEAVEPLALLEQQLVGPLGFGSRQCPGAPIGELLHRDAVRGVIGHELGDLDRVARRGPHGEHGLGQVDAHVGLDLGVARRLDAMAGAARQGHLAVRASVAQDDLVVTLALVDEVAARGGRTCGPASDPCPRRGPRNARGTRPRRPDG